MGYGIRLVGSSFRIKRENMLPAFKAIQGMAGKAKPFWSGDKNPHWSYVQDNELLKSYNLPEIMDVWQWPIKWTETDGVFSIDFEGENSGDEFEMFKVIAPYVEEGSYLEIYGSDGDKWRWIFKNGVCWFVQPIIQWPEITEEWMREQGKEVEKNKYPQEILNTGIYRNDVDLGGGWILSPADRPD